jgi:hypothetical protein
MAGENVSARMGYSVNPGAGHARPAGPAGDEGPDPLPPEQAVPETPPAAQESQGGGGGGHGHKGPGLADHIGEFLKGRMAGRAAGDPPAGGAVEEAAEAII